MKTLVLSLLAGLLIQSTLVLAGVQDSTLKDTTESKYKVGQMWSYKTRPGEEKSYFIVVKVETHPKLGNIVHIAVRKLKMQNRRSPDGISEDVNHMPFSEGAINKSAVKILKDKLYDHFGRGCKGHGTHAQSITRRTNTPEDEHLGTSND